MRYTDARIRKLLMQLKDMPSEELENETAEFKGYRTERSLHNASDLAEEISALANKAGGLIIIGVQDSSDIRNGDWKSQLTGIEDTDNLSIRERLVGKLQPVVNLEVHSIEFEGKHYVAIEVPHRSDTLVSAKGGKVCIRDGRSSRPTSWKTFLKASRTFRVSGTSTKHVKLYSYLKRHGDASNSDVTELLGHRHSSQTSAFLRDAQYTKRTGVGPSARWSLAETTA